MLLEIRACAFCGYQDTLRLPGAVLVSHYPPSADRRQYGTRTRSRTRGNQMGYSSSDAIKTIINLSLPPAGMPADSSGSTISTYRTSTSTGTNARDERAASRPNHVGARHDRPVVVSDR
eukprot:scaffold94653_cov28-Prasinocladus_malaysianus.AAC.1